MKKITLLLLFFLSLSGCSEDDTKDTGITYSKEEIQGTWALKRETIEGVETTLNTCRLNERHTFSGSVSTMLLNSFNGTTGTNECYMKSETGYFVIEKDKIFFSEEEGAKVSLIMKVMKLTNTKLVLGIPIDIFGYKVIQEFEKVQE